MTKDEMNLFWFVLSLFMLVLGYVLGRRKD